MKITYSTDTVSAFGGLNFVNNSLGDRGLQSRDIYQ